MESSSRRKILKGGISGLSLIAGFPQLFSPALANNDPPKSSKGSKKTVSPSKPTSEENIQENVQENNQESRHRRRRHPSAAAAASSAAEAAAASSSTAAASSAAEAAASPAETAISGRTSGRRGLMTWSAAACYFVAAGFISLRLTSYVGSSRWCFRIKARRPHRRPALNIPIERWQEHGKAGPRFRSRLRQLRTIASRPTGTVGRCFRTDDGGCKVCG